ncbi:MAG: methyltransferase domain-containing protein [Selenomonadaceae bacterium]|nr:methyltransferase domain-containing protein [Selenomonadaceae bacterium]
MDNNQPYDEKFYRAQKNPSFKSAIEILPLVAEFVHPRSVVDVGCGVGTWLAVWQKHGTEIYGVDGDYVDRSQLFIDEKFFHPADLENRLKLKRRFDLAMSLEVAEHLSPERADSFVEDLTRLSDLILFSAAIPAQGGTNHVNEQWPSYWAQKFLQFGYIGIDCLRPKIWTNDAIEISRRQNIFIYAKSAELYRYPELQDYYLKYRDVTIFDAVHPKLWALVVKEFKNFYLQVKLRAENQ